MKVIADFHIHSKYSRATSSQMDLENLDKWAKIKGIKVLGTGDFTHPEWFRGLKEKLEPAEPGLFKLRDSDSGTRFILTAEISSIYTKRDRVRKIHNLIFSPSLETVEKINTQLGWIGNLKSDGRPILGLDAKELAKIVFSVSEDNLIVPAHCLLPDTFLHSHSGIKKIKDVFIGDRICTHKGRIRKVKQVYTRFYKGPIYNIKPYYFGIGLQTTPEHPFYAIKTNKKCNNMTDTVCKPTCSYLERGCSYKFFEKYYPQWISAKNIKRGDILVFPRFNNNTKDIRSIKLSDFLKKKEYRLKKNKILLLTSRTKELPNTIKITKGFCRLIGYYISEGYVDKRDSVSFCFNNREKKYIQDLKSLMKESFDLSSPRVYKRKGSQSVEIIYFSKVLTKVFAKLFYNDDKIKRAHTKCLPQWALNLPLEKQVEIFKGWWRGDAGYTSSRELMNQMKITLLRLGIIPSVGELSKEDFNKNYIHKFRRENRIIKAQHNLFSLYGLSFFQDLFGLLKTSEFSKFQTKMNRKHGWIDENYIYIPVRKIETNHYEGKVYNLEIKEDNSYLSEFAAIHNCMTPWFAIFGSRSGFDSIEECFEDYSKYIYALETGLSADPYMLWRMPNGRKVTLVSNSDAHSPAKIGREVNVFDLDSLSYSSFVEAIKSKDAQKFLYTIEFYPQEGKYHYDGHRKCGISLSPQESKKYNNICPVCGKLLTIGVLNRVEELADRPEGFKPERAIPFKSLIPLREVVAESLGVGTETKGAEDEYNNLVKKFDNEFKTLLDVSREDLETVTLPEVAEGIIRAREGRVHIEPGYDGVFGKIKIFSKEEKKDLSKQETLF